MSKKRLFTSLSSLSAILGAGMLLGHSLSSGDSKTAVFLGIAAILVGAVLFGMSVSSKEAEKEE